jgi:hypothetical protein
LIAVFAEFHGIATLINVLDGMNNFERGFQVCDHAADENILARREGKDWRCTLCKKWTELDIVNFILAWWINAGDPLLPVVFLALMFLISISRG